jgi:hypothetical protein
VILHPAIIALLVSSVLMSFLALYSAYYGAVIVRRWDLTSGSSLQLDLERRTYLISTVLAYVFAFQLASLFLFVFTTDRLCTLFTGAMCAVGTLNVNGYGYPLLGLKIVNFILAGLWLIVNYTDNRGYDYPLIRKKYLFLMVLAPLLIAETVLQALYFLGLHPDVITSCCGSLFSDSGRNFASEMSSLPVAPMKVLLVLSMAMTLGLGMYFYVKGKGGYLFALFSGVSFLIALASILSFISLYVYELPTHHCPFCLLQREYGYIGYLLYGALFSGVVTGLGVGVLMPFRSTASLKTVVPVIQKNLTVLSLLSYLVFTALIIYRVLMSHLVL